METTTELKIWPEKGLDACANEGEGGGGTNFLGELIMYYSVLAEKTTQWWNSLLRVDLAMFRRRLSPCVAILTNFFQKINFPQLTFRFTWPS